MQYTPHIGDCDLANKHRAQLGLSVRRKRRPPLVAVLCVPELDELGVQKLLDRLTEREPATLRRRKSGTRRLPLLDRVHSPSDRLPCLAGALAGLSERHVWVAAKPDLASALPNGCA